jgi:hypothetical protein
VDLITVHSDKERVHCGTTTLDATISQLIKSTQQQQPELAAASATAACRRRTGNRPALSSLPHKIVQHCRTVCHLITWPRRNLRVAQPEEGSEEVL